MGDAALTRPDQTRPDQAGFLGRLTRTQPSHAPTTCLPAYVELPKSFQVHIFLPYPLHFVLHQDQHQDQARPRPSSTGFHPANPHPSPQSSLPTPTSGGGGGGGCPTIASPPSHLGLSQPFIDIDIAIHQ
ncbi:uncharacterized protein RCO7_14885 [Rhynchosporium graminicola]|uniref:Uncharacterized protein n=1 Tax=Rhynchosporium graminicola TaxID=2792576 RepID=A0A1E1L8B5_9HELO|nr:uncharacterized protein RCO7_14885 [Rhynchosporium commune]